MNDQIHSVGEQVDKMCPICSEQLGHTVKSLTKLGKISRVVCSKCGNVGTYKQSAFAAKRQTLIGKSGDPYDSTKTYRAGQVMQHSTFGTGEVMTVFNTKMIDVLFTDRVRRLIHSRL